MILTELHIAGFRGLTGVRLEDLAPVSVIVGSNNAGKSSALEAAALLLRPMDPGQWVAVAKNRDRDLALPDGLWSMFPSDSESPLNTDGKPQLVGGLDVRGVIGRQNRELAAQATATPSVVPVSESADGVAEGVGGDRPTSEIVLRIDTTVDDAGLGPASHCLEFRRYGYASSGPARAHRAFTVTPSTHRSTTDLVWHLSSAIEAGQKHRVVEVLRSFDTKVEDLDISATFGRQAIKVRHEERGVVDLSSFGDGMRRAAAMAMALTRSSGGLLLVDEIEAGIHHSALEPVLRQLLGVCAQIDVQLLTTTHSLESLDALRTAATAVGLGFAAYHVRAKGGTHHVRRYGADKVQAFREEGFDLR